METEFNYYVIEPEITERTPLLMNDPNVNPQGVNFLYGNSMVSSDYTAYLQFLMPLKNPDMDTDYLFLESFAVFSKKIYDELQKHKPIESLQLVKAVINENGEVYDDFWISYPYREIRSFDQEKSNVRRISKEGVWFGLKNIVLNIDLLEQIPLI